jgi:hypothetical protein
MKRLCYLRNVSSEGWGAIMKKILTVTGTAALALVLMDSSQVLMTRTGLFVAPGGQALAADLPMPAPVGKGKAPIIGKGKGKAPIVTRG